MRAQKVVPVGHHFATDSVLGLRRVGQLVRVGPLPHLACSSRGRQASAVGCPTPDIPCLYRAAATAGKPDEK